MSSVVVVGAGIVGASVAYHLACRGVAVTLVDREETPAAGVTRASFAWIGESGGDWPGGAEDLRPSVLADHRRLEEELPGAAVRRTGSLAWGGPRALRPGRGQRWAERSEIAVLEPRLRTPPERAVHTPTDAGVDPVRTTAALVEGARALGARLVTGAAGVRLETAGGRVTGVRSSAGLHRAEVVVLAAGTGVPGLCEPLGARLPVAVSPALLLAVAAPPGLVRTIVCGPAFEAREVRDGRLLLTAPYDDGLTAAALRGRVRETVEALRAAFRGAGEARLLGHRIGRRPMPAGGPIVGYTTPDRSVYVAVMHAAVTLAPTAGRLVAREIDTGEPAPELRRCRPGFEN